MKTDRFSILCLEYNCRDSLRQLCKGVDNLDPASVLKQTNKCIEKLDIQLSEFEGLSHKIQAIAPAFNDLYSAKSYYNRILSHKYSILRYQSLYEGKVDINNLDQFNIDLKRKAGYSHDKLKSNENELLVLKKIVTEFSNDSYLNSLKNLIFDDLYFPGFISYYPELWVEPLTFTIDKDIDEDLNVDNSYYQSIFYFKNKFGVVPAGDYDYTSLLESSNNVFDFDNSYYFEVKPDVYDSLLTELQSPAIMSKYSSRPSYKLFLEMIERAKNKEVTMLISYDF